MGKANEDEHDHLPRFDDRTRNELMALFEKEYKTVWQQCRDDDAAREAGIFVACLEGLTRYSLQSKPENEQRRKERVEAFANALDKLIDAGFAMDDPALGYAIWRGMSEVLKASNFDDEDRTHHDQMKGWPSISEAYEIQNNYATHLKDFALGVRHAIKELPDLDKGSCSFEAQTARFIEDYLGRAGIQFSTSDTGLAGKAFLAVMELAGTQKGRATYWLGKATKSEDSWKHFLERINQRMTD
ncbi:MAG: hypothetical protein AB1482_05775 [Pseudomonadota bacterium]|jgi:hypothetical protein